MKSTKTTTRLLLLALFVSLMVACKHNQDSDANQSNDQYPAVDNSTTTDNPNQNPDDKPMDTVAPPPDGSNDTKNGPGYNTGTETGK